MGKKLYVGNLSYNMGDSDLQQLFAACGTVSSAQVIMDRESGRSKGFGFVEMGTDQEATAAISALNGKEIDGRALTVKSGACLSARKLKAAVAAADTVVVVAAVVVETATNILL